MLFIGIQMEDQVYKTAQLVHAGLIVLPALFPLLGVLSVVACVFFRSGESWGRET